MRAHAITGSEQKPCLCVCRAAAQRYQALTSEKARSQRTCVCVSVCAGGSAEGKIHKDLPEKSEQGEGLF